MHLDFNPLLLDIINYKSTFKNLLRFYIKINKDFRFNIDYVKDIIFFIYKESSFIALIYNIYGYSYLFPKAHTI
jgi:hypothetical protein